MLKFTSQDTAVILFGALIACFIGLYNGYPLVYPDTGTYLDSGFGGFVPMDRTIFYGLFARHISLSASPWLIIFAQGWLLCWSLHHAIGMFFNGLKRNLFFISSVLMATLFTGLSYNVSILIPDVFSAIALLCFLCLLLHRELSTLNKVFMSLLFVFSLCTHLSNIPTFLGCTLIAAGIFLIRRKKQTPAMTNARNLLLAGGLCLSPFLIVPSVNYLHGDQFQVSKSAHVFMVNHLIETGVMEQFLRHECDSKEYRLCEYKENLGWNFIWNQESSLYKTGGWEANREEFNTLILDIHTSPRYWPLLLQKTVEYTFKQFFSFETNVHPPLLEHTAPMGQINWRFHDSVREYIASRQSNAAMSTDWINAAEMIVILLSFVLIAMVILIKEVAKLFDPRLVYIYTILIIYGLVNSAVCANLSTVVSRYQNRWIWLLPIFALLGLYLLWNKHRTALIKRITHSDETIKPRDHG